MATPEAHAVPDDAAEQQIISDVAKYGFHVAIVPSDGYSPGFAYTIGLFKTFGYPELICFSLNQDLLHSMFWTAKELFDQQPQPDLALGYPNFIDDFDVRFLPVAKANYSDYFGYGRWFYKGWDFPALQIVWPDKQAVFPWEASFNSNWVFAQPLLNRNHDFKFREEPNLGVYTTRQVLEDQPILRVVHNADGDWQFLGDPSYQEDDLRIVALAEIVAKDPTVNELFQLNYGWRASRTTAGEKWQKEEFEDEEDAAE